MNNFKPFLEKYSSSVILEQTDHYLFIEIDVMNLLSVVAFLIQNNFNRLVSLGGVDFIESKDNANPHFEVIYQFGKYDGGADIIALKVKISRSEPTIASITRLIAGANWHERETYDMYGIKFAGHPNLTRIFLPDNFPGFPLRKDWHGEDSVPLIFNDESGEPPTNLIEEKIEG